MRSIQITFDFKIDLTFLLLQSTCTFVLKWEGKHVYNCLRFALSSRADGVPDVDVGGQDGPVDEVGPPEVVRDLEGMVAVCVVPPALAASLGNADFFVGKKCKTLVVLSRISFPLGEIVKAELSLLVCVCVVAKEGKTWEPSFEQRVRALCNCKRGEIFRQ